MEASMTEKQWIDLIAGDAQRAAKMYGYLPSVLIAQTCQENGYGADPECAVLVEANNLLGMKRELLNSTWKSNYWHGVCITKRTPEWYNGRKTYITDEFRSYSSILDCFYDYCQFMRDARYDVGGAFKYRDLLGTKDPYTLIEGVRSRGYCTDPEYSRAIMRIIEKHNLTKYDEVKKMVKPTIINRIAENEDQVPAHNANSHEYIAIHYLGVNGENPDLYGGGYGGHFFVYLDGRCSQAAKVTDKLWHVGASSGFRYIHPYARNANTIGIECATYSIGDRWFFTKATQEACARLTAWIMSEYNIPMDHLLRHGDITTKHCPSPYIDNPGDGPNWTWEQFKAKVAEYLGNAPERVLTPVQRLVATGQRHSINYCAHHIDCDGVYGKESRKNAVRCLQRAANIDWDANLSIDGIVGEKTRGTFEGHYIKRGECQDMVTAVEIIMYLKGRNPNGVEVPGTFGAGLAKALGTEYLSGPDILKLVD